MHSDLHQLMGKSLVFDNYQVYVSGRMLSAWFDDTDNTHASITAYALGDITAVKSVHTPPEQDTFGRERMRAELYDHTTLLAIIDVTVARGGNAGVTWEQKTVISIDRSKE